MKKKIIMVLVLLAGFLLNGQILLKSDDVAEEDNINSIYSDHKAYKVGDIVTINVVESAQATQSSALTTQKQQSLGGGMGMSAWGGGTTNPFPNVPSWGMAGEETQNGQGTSSKSGTLMAKISAKVEKILSNGNLVIKGVKIVEVNEEKQNLTVTGTIRPEDIASDNTIDSTYVADANIQYEGKGPLSEKTSPGIITRILDWLGIF